MNFIKISIIDTPDLGKLVMKPNISVIKSKPRFLSVQRSL